MHNPSRPEHFSTVYLQSITMDIRQWKGRGCVLYFACQMSWWCAFYLLERKWKGECARAIHPAVKNYTVEFGFPNHYVSHNQRIIHPAQWCTLRSFSLIGERDQRRSGKLPLIWFDLFYKFDQNARHVPGEKVGEMGRKRAVTVSRWLSPLMSLITRHTQLD